MLRRLIYKRRYGDATTFILRYKKTHRNRLPWVITYQNIKGRCEREGTSKFIYYGGRGIRCLVTTEDLKRIFYRDKAWKLRQPSIDRKNSNGNYILDNIRWIEFSKNRKWRAPNMHITIKEIAKAVGCSQENVNYHIHKGNIPFEKTETGHYFIKADLLPMIKKIIQNGQK